MDWDDVRHFLALARTGSVRGAGASVGVSHSTVLRRVEALEDGLAVRLFDRNRDGWTLTEAGHQMLPGAERVEREMAALERGLVGRDDRLEGPVALTCSDDYISELLIRELRPFCEAHPEIELHFFVDGRNFDLGKREADIAVRMVRVGSTPAEHLVGFELVPIKMANYVAVAHAAACDPTIEGSEPRWVGFDDRKVMRQLVARSSWPDLPVWGAFASLNLMVRALRHGHGIGMLPTYVGDSEPGLRRLQSADLVHVANLWLLTHPDLRQNARFRLIREEVAAIVRRFAGLFHGDWPGGAPPGSESAPPAAGTAPLG